ncbi:hypothetical protein JXO59_01870 [candidate division KSB1 bacterium]|nr:hypothetical protein [candidate division KSB1 bacterium]
MAFLRKIITAQSGFLLWLVSTALLADFANLIDFYPQLRSFHIEDVDLMAVADGYEDQVRQADTSASTTVDLNKFSQRRPFLYDLDGPLHTNITQEQNNDFILFFLFDTLLPPTIESNKPLYLLNCTFLN